MTKFVTIGYGDQRGYDRTDTDARDAAHRHDAVLADSGVEMGKAGTPVLVRNHDNAGTRIEAGPFMHSDLPVAGFALIEAETIEEAIEMVSHTPCAVAYGVVEVWPLE